MDNFVQTPIQLILFFILYGVTGAMPLLAALYLLLRRGNAFAPDITPPVRLRRWAASFFAVSALGHVWWLLFYVYSRNYHSMEDAVHSVGYVAIVVFDCVTVLTTLAGTLLSMLQDRRRRIWPVLVAMIPFVALDGVYLLNPNDLFVQIAFAYVLLFYVLFTVYMVFAVRRYGQWLNDNYADLENKKVWLSMVVALGSLSLFIIYTFVDIDSILLIYLMHFIELVMFILLLWRVETLAQLESISTEKVSDASILKTEGEPDVPTSVQQPSSSPISIDLTLIEQQLAEHCVANQLYLRHNLTLQELAQAVGTNRSYLSQYFSRQGITYNTYINNLRINHFISRYQELTQAGEPIVALQLAQESGFRSYSTFGRAFMQRTGQSVTVWMRETTE